MWFVVQTEQLIVFLTDGEPTAGVTSSSAIKKNIREANADTQIPIYGLALGDGADFDLVKDISDENYGFAERIYESGNSFEQLEDFYNKISGTQFFCIFTKSWKMYMLKWFRQQQNIWSFFPCIYMD